MIVVRLAPLLLFSLGVVLCSGCELAVSGLGLQDAGRGSDAAGTDAGARDASVDAGERDAGEMDAGPPDLTDAGPVDAGPFDAGEADAGPGPLPVTRGLWLHLDARLVPGDGSAPGATPSTWVDLTGGNDASCSDMSYDADGLAVGRPAMRADGSGESRCAFQRPDLMDLTIAVVFRTSDRRGASNWYEAPVLVGGDANGNAEDAAMHFTDGRIGFARRGNGLQFHDSMNIADGAPHVATLVRRDSDGRVRLLVDGRARVESTNAGSGRIRDPNDWYLAGHEHTLGGLDCHYAEVLVYDRELNDPNAQAVHDWLRARWGI